MQPTHPATSISPTTPASQWRHLVVVVVGSVVATAAVLAALLAVVNRGEWWRGYFAATIAVVLAAGASLVPLAWGLRRGGPAVVQMFMASSALRGAVAIGVAALAVGVGRYPTLPTFVLLMPYYLVLLAVETGYLARSMKTGS